MLNCNWNPLYSTLKVDKVDLKGKTAIVTGCSFLLGHSQNISKNQR